MPIKVQCPNAACGQIITVRDEYVGKRGKCPACGAAMMIPTTAAREVPTPRQPPPQDRPRSGILVEVTDTAGLSPLTPVEDLGLPSPDVVDAAAEPPEPPPPPSAPAPGLLSGYTMADLATRTALIIGIVALVLLSLVPQARWLYISTSSRENHFLMQADLTLWATGSGVGLTLLVYSALLAFLAVVCLVCLDLLARETSDALIAAIGGLAGGWGVTVLFWMLGFIWKALTTAGKHGSRDVTILPGFGLIFGFFAALSAIAVFGYLVISRRRFLWLGAAGILGFFFGMLLLLFSARPWEAWRIGGA